MMVVMATARTTGEIGAALKQGRKDADLSLMEAAYGLRDHVPKGFWKTGETIRAYEKGLFDPDDMSVVIVLQALAKMYGIEIDGLTDSHKADWKRLAELMVMSTLLPALYITYMDGTPNDRRAGSPGGDVGRAESPLLLVVAAA